MGTSVAHPSTIMSSQTSWYMGYVAENVRRFFHPAAIDEMLSTFLPSMSCISLNVSTVHVRIYFYNIR